MPEVGRFASPDTIVPDPSNPQSYNRYSYVRNNPINLTDPTGHRECAALCDGETSWIPGPLPGSAYSGDWNPIQQVANQNIAETVFQDVSQAVIGVLWEPADWAIALSDGFQWYDSFGLLPLVPATVGRYADDVIPIAQRAIGGTGRAYDRLNAQGLYVLLDDAGNVQYIGRGDAPARLLSHAKDEILSAFRQVELASNNLTYAEARGLEQLLIDQSGGVGNLLNNINGISLRNPQRGEYLAAGQPLLEEALQLLRWRQQP